MMKDDSNEPNSWYAGFERMIFPKWLFDPENAKYRRRATIAYCSALLTILILLIYPTLVFIQHRPVFTFMDLGTAVALVGVMVYFRLTKGPDNYAIQAGIAIGGFFSIYLCFFGEAGNPTFPWAYTFPLGAMFLLGSRRGTIAVTLFLLTVTILLIFDHYLPYVVQFPLSMKLRLVGSLFMVSVLSYLFEQSREKANQRMKLALSELGKSKEEIEQQVRSRTTQLFQINEKLLREIQERKQAEEKLNEANLRLQMLQKITASVHSTLDLEEVFKQITDSFVYSMGFNSAIIVTRNDEINQFEVKALSSQKWIITEVDKILGFPLINYSFPIDSGLNASVRAAMKGEMVVAKTAEELAYPLISKTTCSMLQELGEIKNYILVPLRVDQEVVGGVIITSAREEVSEEEFKMVNLFVQAASHAIRNAKLHTQIKQVEGALRESEEKYRSLYDDAPVGYHELDVEGRITKVNRTELAMLGYTEEEMIGQPVWKFNAEEASERTVKEKITGERAIGKGFERTYFRKNGTRLPVIIEDLSLKDNKGRITGIRSTIQDITERKRIEDMLLIIRQAIDNSGDAIGMSDPPGHHFYQNKAFTDLFQYTAEELETAGGGVAAYVDQAVAREVFNTIMSGRAWNGEVEMVSKSGRKFPVLLRANAIKDDLGRIVGLIGIHTDITEHKQSEEALRESEVRYRLLAENATDVIWTVDMNLNLTYVSPSVEQARGYTVEEAMAQKLPEIYTPDSLAVVERVFAEELAIENREQKDLNRDRTLELEYKCKGGSTIWSEVKISFIRDSSGRAMGILGVGRNITKRKKVEKEKADLQQQLQQAQKMEAVGRLAGGIAHDFNNLLTVIQGYGDLALIGLKEEGPLKRALEEINKAGERAATLTHQLLAFSRRQILELKIVNLNDTLRNLNKMLQRLIGEDIELVTVLGEGLGKVKVDPGQMEQVIMNLAVNARDAMPMGGRLILETSNVEVREKYARSHIDLKVGSYVMLSVRDTGGGIAPEVKDYIFEPFFTTKEIGKGTGLGLSMVYGMVNQSGGSVGVESELGRGTTFKIYFPQVVEGVKELEARPVKQEIPRGSETVLVVEDDGAVRKLATQMLKKQGYRVLEASNGEEALGLYGVRKEPIHLVLTDVVMPRMSGPVLGEHLISVYPEMKIVYMSGYTDDAIVHYGVLEKRMGYIHKPFTMEGLAKKVREVLDKELS